MSNKSTNGSCLRDALIEAGVLIPNHVRLPDWIEIEEIPALCAKLNLRWHENCALELDVEPVIVLYPTTPGKGHAIYLEDIGPFLKAGKDIIGLIKLKE